MCVSVYMCYGGEMVDIRVNIVDILRFQKGERKGIQRMGWFRLAGEGPMES